MQEVQRYLPLAGALFESRTKPLLTACCWNVIIGGQMFCRSFCGYVHYDLTLDGREGLIAAVIVLTLPLLALFAASRLLPLIGDAETHTPRQDLCRSMPLDVCTSHQ